MCKPIYEELVAGGYSSDDAAEIILLYNQYIAEKRSFAEQLEAEGKPANGSDYELMCEQAWRYYQQQLDMIDASYDWEE